MCEPDDAIMAFGYNDTMTVRRRIAWLLATIACGCGNATAPPSAGGSGSAIAHAASASPDATVAPAGGDLGAMTIKFSGGSPEARAKFSHGLLALHSFWYDQASADFTSAIALDPTFSMAYWGLAMSKSKLLWGDDDLDAGRDALKRMPAPNLLPAYDQAWVVAALALFRRAEVDVVASRTEFAGIMQKIYDKYPDDESATFLALALLSTIRPTTAPADADAIRERAGELANTVFQRNPQHPGAAHYLIHAFDTPALAPRALAAARKYATIAPSAFHARHMPAHIFVRLGMWKDAQASCQAAWDTSLAWIAGDKLGIDHADFHSLAWLVEIGFERGRRADADAALAHYIDAVKTGLPHSARAAYANQVLSYVARTGEWKRVDELLAPLAATPALDDVHTAGGSACGGHAVGPIDASNGALLEQRAIVSTRATAAAFLGDVNGLTRLLAERDAIDVKLRPFLVSTQTKEFVASGDKLKAAVRASLIARAKHDDRALIVALRPLADDQESEFTGEGMTGGLLNHEEIATALERLHDDAGAMAEYRADANRVTTS
jgi:hypothetical protein